MWWDVTLIETPSTIPTKPTAGFAPSFAVACDRRRLVERFLMDDYKPHQLSTYALTLFKHNANVDGKDIVVGMSRRKNKRANDVD